MALLKIEDHEIEYLLQAAEEKFDRMVGNMLHSKDSSKFSLSAERVQLLKDCHMWDDEKLRDAAIRNFMLSDKSMESRNEVAVRLTYYEMRLADGLKKIDQFTKPVDPPKEETVPEEPKAKKPKKVAKKTEDAPWGYKKDGTPKKRPGRPVRTEA